MKSPKVNYKIKRENFEKPLDITIDLSEIEKVGLEQYLKNEKLLDEHYSYEVLSRFIPQKKTFNNNTEHNKGNYKKVDRKEIPFRVELHSVEYYRINEGFPRYVDVFAPTPGKAIMIAQNKVGFTTFPQGWNDMVTQSGERVPIPDFGKYELGDEKNVYKQKMKSYNH